MRALLLPTILGLFASTVLADSPLNTLEKMNNKSLPANVDPCPRENSMVGCSEAFESFCDRLYSPENQGNLDLSVGEKKVPIRLGKNPAGINYTYLLYQQAKLAAESRLPADLRAKLDASGYFSDMKSFLSQNEGKPSRSKIVEINQRSRNLTETWTAAIEQAALDRFEKTHPGFGAQDPAPLKDEREYSRFKSQFTAEIYKSIWSEHPDWKKAQTGFEQVRKDYLKVIAELPLPEKIKGEWKERIRVMTLDAPGSNPDDEDQSICGSTSTNAYYWKARNSMMVCGGDLLTESVSATLAHEIGGALDVDTALYHFLRDSSVGKELQSLRKEACTQAPLKSCPPRWRELSANSEALTKSLEGFDPAGKKFLSCLQSEDPEDAPSRDVIAKLAKSEARRDVRSYAESHSFSKLILPQLMNKNGQLDANPSYLNPCDGKPFQENELDLSNTVRLLFTLEYVCSSDPSASAERFKSAIDSSRKLHQAILEKIIPSGGKFSPHESMSDEGYAEDVSERFSDAIGYRVYAEQLKKVKPASVRRATFFANSAWMCEAPSFLKPLSIQGRTEAQIEAELAQEEHSENLQRRKEVLTPEIREALGCKKDFERQDCRL